MSKGYKPQQSLAVALCAVAGLAVASGEARADAESWPLEVISRPLTLPQGSFSAGLALSANNDFSVIDGAATGLWGMSYGVTDDLSVGLGYGLGLRDFEGRGPLDANVGFTYFTGDILTLTATGGYSHDFDAGTDSVSVGSMAWLMLTDRFALISPGGQLSVGLDDPTPASLSLPVAVGAQATPHVFAQLGVNIAEIGISETDTTVIGADQVGLELSGFYSPTRSIDIGAAISADPKTGIDDTLAFGLIFIYYGGV